MDTGAAYPSRRTNLKRAEVLVDGETPYVLTLRSRPGYRRFSDPRTGETRVERADSLTTDVHLYAIGPYLDPPALKSIEGASAEAFGAELQRVHVLSARFEELLAEGREAPELLSNQDVAASRVLRDRAIRSLATAIKSSSGLLSDASKQVGVQDQDRVEDLIRTLEGVGLVAREVVVVCKKTNAQVNRLPSADAIDSLDAQGVRCSCGRSLSEERCEEALTTTDAGRNLLDGNRWFTVTLICEPVELGVPIGAILVEQDAGGDESTASA